MFGMPDPNFFDQMKKVILGIMSDAGLTTVTDIEQATSGLPFGLAPVEFTDQEKEVWNDEPAIDRFFNLFLKSTKMRPPSQHTARIIGVLPDSCTTVVRVAIAFTPLDSEHALDLDECSTWIVKFTDGQGKGGGFSGKITDRIRIEAALRGITDICQDVQKQYKLKPAARDEIGPYIGGGAYRSAMPAPMPAEGIG